MIFKLSEIESIALKSNQMELKLPKDWIEVETNLQSVMAMYRSSHVGRRPSLYYVRVFWGFFEPPTHLRKDIFTT